MISVDTNILVRVYTQDDEIQAKEAKNFLYANSQKNYYLYLPILF